MEKDDAQLIREILSGDDAAFSTLIQKYQRIVHAFVWRKIGDFHYAEEITQDTFLRAYRKLSSLRDPTRFSRWLNVIANRLCLNWIERKNPEMQSIEETSMAAIEESAYIQYASEKQETEAAEYLYGIVKKLLDKLPDAECTVMTLYYLGEMTTKEISEFLGVSVNTITSQLQRARERLQEDKEWLCQEIFGRVQLS